jgi:hypothetical protein
MDTADARFDQLSSADGDVLDSEAESIDFTVTRELHHLTPNPSASQVDRLVGLADDVELFCSPNGKTYVTFSASGHFETWPLADRAFVRGYLGQLYRETYGSPPSRNALSEAIEVLEGHAIYDGAVHNVHVRLAGGPDCIYVDLGDGEWSVVKITAAGWALVANAPVKFRRPLGLQALPRPERGGTIELLSPFINATGPGLVLVVAWLIGTFHLTGPYPILLLIGEQGSAKSTTAQTLCRLVDPSQGQLRAAPKGVQDLMVSAHNHHVLCFDNLSHLPDWLSDGLCRLSTGGGYASRRLYTDDEEVILEAERPVCLTAIEDVANRSDLLDRCIIVILPPIPEAERQSEKEFGAAFGAAQPKILGALFDAVAAAIKNESDVVLDRRPRLADFAVWVSAAEEALGWPKGTFIEAYAANRSAAHDIALEASPVGLPLLEIGNAGFEGTMSDLLATLASSVEQAVTGQKDWPKSPRSLSGVVKRLSPNLRAMGISIENVRETTGRKRRLVCLSRADGSVTRVTDATRAAEEPAAAYVPGISGDAGDASDGSDLALDVLLSSPELELLAERLLQEHSDIAWSGDEQ